MSDAEAAPGWWACGGRTRRATVIDPETIDRFRVPPGSKVLLKDGDPGWAQTEELKELGKGEVKERARAILAKNIEDLAAAQELLWANDTSGVLAVFQAMDAAGKDSTIKHVNGEEERPPSGALD